MNIIVAGNMSKDIIVHLINLGFNIYFTPRHPGISAPVSYHPDMQVISRDKTLVCAPELVSCYKGMPLPGDVVLTKGKTSLGCNYPEDIAYNVKVVGDNLFHSISHTDPVTEKILSDKRKIDVRQGYSGCSICAVSQNAIITADMGIYKAANHCGLKALIIQPGYISLPGYDYGFIGGASFLFNKTVYFFGDITQHPDYSKIESFCGEEGSDIVSLGDGELSDYGGAITF